MAQGSGCCGLAPGGAVGTAGEFQAMSLGGTCSALVTFLVFPLGLVQADKLCFNLPLVFEVCPNRGGTILV